MSRLLSRSHTFAIIVILDLKIHQSMWIHWPFFQKLEPKVIDPRWPLTPCLLRSHVWLYPRIIVSKSHDNTSMYVDTVINFAKYHIHTHTTYIHIHTTFYVQNEWSHSLLLNSVQARQKWKTKQTHKQTSKIALRGTLLQKVPKAWNLLFCMYCVMNGEGGPNKELHVQKSIYKH